MLSIDWYSYHIDMKDPLIIDWVLKKIDDISKVDESKSDDIEARLFNDITIRHLLEHADDELLTNVFYHLKPERFTNHLQTLISRWPEWEDTVASWSARIIARLNGHEAYRLFSNSKALRSGDMNKIFGVIDSLEYLPAEYAERLAHNFIDMYIGSSDNHTAQFYYLTSAVRLAWQYKHPELERLVRDFILLEKYKGRYYTNLSDLSLLILGSTLDYNFICDRYGGYTEQGYASVPNFFIEGAPLVDIDNLINPLKRHKYNQIQEFYEENCYRLSKAEIRSLLDNLIHDDNLIESLHKKEQRPFFYAFILGCVAQSFRVDKILLDGLAIEEVIDLLATDFEETPFFESFTSFFSAKDHMAVTHQLIDACSSRFKDSSVRHIINMMGELKRDDYVSHILRALESDNDFIYSAAKQALLKYGDSAVPVIAKDFDTLNKHARVSALYVLRAIGGNGAVQLIDKYFDELWPEDKELVLSLMESAPDERFIRILAPKVNKGQFLIDRTYVILNKLLGDSTSEVKTVEKKVFKRERDDRAFRKSIKQGNLVDTVLPYIDLELKCTNCGDQNIYRINEIFLSPQGKGGPYIADEITCINCDQHSEFDVTAQGMLKIMAETIRLAMITDKKEKEEASERSPIKLIDTTVKGKRMAVSDGIAKYSNDIRKDPLNPENYIGLGNIYHHTNQLSQAEGYFKKALEIDPTYVEVYYSLAVIADKRKDYQSACDWLEKGTEFIQTAKYSKRLEINKSDFGEIYVRFYNEMLSKSGKRMPSLHPGTFSEKIGRNDPCPCGSGTKYKKCCYLKLH